MAEEIKIKKKIAKRGDDGYKIVSVRMKDELIYCSVSAGRSGGSRYDRMPDPGSGTEDGICRKGSGEPGGSRRR